jgi:hypothetical protein
MRSAWAGLVVASAASGAAGQNVHKCVVNGQATYQATPCAGDDNVVPMTSGPSEQEVRAARAQALNQRFEAATGRLHTFVPPPPSPPQATPPATVTITSVRTRVGSREVTTTTVTRTPAPGSAQSNCTSLDEAMADARAKLEAAQGHADLAARPEIARKAQADIDRVRQQAAASDCKLAH